MANKQSSVANKKARLLICLCCLLSLSAMGIFFGLHFQNQSICSTHSTATAEATQQNGQTSQSVDVFENYTRTSLKEEYNDKLILDQMKESAELGLEEYERAVEVLNGNARYTSKREFSTAFENDNKIDQVGDIAQYSQTALNCIWPASEIILTGIYGFPDDTFNVFVEANETTDKLPYILFSQNHGYYTHWYNKIQLKNGWNKLTFPTFGLALVDKDEIIGGAVYLCNPYFPEEQGKVNVYIEGGGYYPVFRKGGNESEFLNFLAEYETERKSETLLDMAELVTDHAIISTTSSSLYDVYFNNNVITPSENLNLWGNYFTTLFEFNGIPTSQQSHLDVPYDPRNDYVKINFRYMTYYQGSGAYSYSYHIGWYYEHYWFANFYNAKNPIKDHNLSEHLIFGIGHELGHALDNEPRKINETTNNFTAAMAYFKIVGMPHYEQYQPFEKTIKALSNDYALDHKAYDDGQIMYTKSDYPTNYDHNYLIWWDLEAVFPNFWAKFNNYFRGELESGLSMEEKYVYYSSLATGVDLSDYYQRWGFYYGKSFNEWSHRFVYSTSSEKFKNLMEQAKTSGKISKRYDHFWYADGTQYDFSISHQNVLEADKAYKGQAPSITKIIKTGSERTVYIQGERDENHLGYEVMSKVDGVWKLAGFTYGSSFVDKNYYTQNPVYKVVAINRYFNPSEQSQEYSTVSSETPSVCRIDGQYFNSIHDAYEAAADGQTIYLLADQKLEFIHLLKNVNIEVDPSIQNDIFIDTNQTYIQCQSELTVKGRTNAKIIFDGNQRQSTTPLIYGSGSKLVAENVVFRNMQTVYLAGVVYAPGMDVELFNCSFENCKDLKEDGIIHASQKVKLDNCTFLQIEEPCVNISNLDGLTLSNKVDKLGIVFDDFDDAKSIKLEGSFTKEILNKIQIKSGYMLKFQTDSILVSKILFRLKFYEDETTFEYQINSNEFEFGTEQHEYGLAENQYVEYEERASGKKYKTGDTIVLAEDAEFNVKIKDKLSLKIFYKDEQCLSYYAEAQEIYLPTIDNSKNAVFAYMQGDRLFGAGQIYTIKSNTTLVAVYLGKLTYRYFVQDQIFDVGYGTYGQNIDLLVLDQEGFLGWQCGAETVSGSLALKGDVDFIAVLSGELPKVYDLQQCEIDIQGNYTYSGEQIMPKITVYFNGMIVPSRCYVVSYSNNISASQQAQVVISFVEGLSTGSKTEYFTIQPKQLKLSDINVMGLSNFVYNGQQTEQNLEISYNNANIETFSQTYIGDRINAGKVQVKIEFFENYGGEIYLEYTISKAERENFKVVQTGWTYGDQSTPPPSTQGQIETANVTFTYSNKKDGAYENDKPKNAGTYWIKAVIEESRNYNSAQAKALFTIEKADHPQPMPSTQMMIGRKIETLKSVKLIDGWEWENPNTKIDADTILAFAVFWDTNNYKNYRVEIAITKEPPKDVSAISVQLEESNFVYDGKAKLPKIVAMDGDLMLALGQDYDVQYENNKFAGKGTAIVTFKDDYQGTTKLDFIILQAERPNVATVIHFNQQANKLSDIPLPEGFVWENENIEITDVVMTAKAIYKGEDASSYKTTEIYFQIIFHQQPAKSSIQVGWILLITAAPVAALLVAWAGIAIAEHRRKKWWKNK